ncbi:unnamed protein product, partial [Dicrocoelium dendriticum]
MRFAFKLKGSGVSIQPDLPLADGVKLKAAIQDLKSSHTAGESGLRLVGFSDGAPTVHFCHARDHPSGARSWTHHTEILHLVLTNVSSLRNKMCKVG